MIVALRALRDGAADDTREVVDRTLAKLEAAAAGRLDPRVDPGGRPGRRRRRRATAADLERAARERRQVRLRYYVPSRDEVTERVVDPRGVVTAHGFTYLDA